MFELLKEASPVVQAVMAILIVISVFSWIIAGMKWARMSQARSHTLKFLSIFFNPSEGNNWSGSRLEAVYAQLNVVQSSPIAKMFQAAYTELARIGADGLEPNPDQMDNIERSLRRAQNTEMTLLESYLPFLATTGSVGPFIGLFGTVYGIMNAFLNIDATQNVSLNTVAPGIAEALFATAIGLVAAIPAVILYNYFIRRIRVLESEADAFGQDFLNIIRRNFLR